MAAATPGLEGSPFPPVMTGSGRSSPVSPWVLARMAHRAQRAAGPAGRAPWPSFQQAVAELSARGSYPPGNASRPAQLAWAALEMETQFLQQVWRAMRQTIPEGGLLPKNPAEKLFEDMLDEERSHLMARSGQLGLAQQIYERMIPYVDLEPED